MHKSLKKSLIVLEQVNNELGIDMTKYQNNELLLRVTNLIMIQKSFFSSFATPVLISLTIFIVGFFVLDLHIIGSIIFGIFGFLLYAFIGVLFGIFRMLSRLKNDIRSVVSVALQTTQNILTDLNVANKHFKKDVENPIGLVFEGTIASIITPVICSTFDKIPLIGNFLIGGSDKVLNLIVANFKKYESKMKISTFLDSKSTFLEKKGENLDQFVNTFSGTIDSTIEKGFNFLQKPTKILLNITIIITVLFTFILYII